MIIQINDLFVRDLAAYDLIQVTDDEVQRFKDVDSVRAMIQSKADLAVESIMRRLGEGGMLSGKIRR